MPAFATLYSCGPGRRNILATSPAEAERLCRDAYGPTVTPGPAGPSIPKDRDKPGASSLADDLTPDDAAKDDKDDKKDKPGNTRSPAAGECFGCRAKAWLSEHKISLLLLALLAFAAWTARKKG